MRFTAWLSAAEREGIARMAAEQHSSDNYIVRMAIREYLGLSARSSRLSQVTNEQVER